MATADAQEQVIHPFNFVPLAGPLFNPGNFRRIGLQAYFVLPFTAGAGFSFEYRCNTNGTPVLGMNFQIPIVDPAEGDGAPGLVLSLGIQHKRIVSGTDDLTATGASTEVEINGTTDATQGQVVYISSDQLAAALDGSYAAGDRCLVTIVRRTTDASDTHMKTVLIGPIGIRELTAT